MSKREKETWGIGRRTLLLLVAGLMLLALGVRTLPQWSGVIQGGRAVVSDPDACYHVRRAHLIAHNFPDLALSDSYINFPEGGRVIWPPLYDSILAAWVSLMPVPESVPGLSIGVALLPPLLFSLTVLTLFLLARRLWPGRPLIQVIAAGVPILLPASFPYTGIAQVDHHAAELLLTALFLHALSNALERTRDGASPFRSALLPALVLAAALATQLSLVLLIGLALVSLPLMRPAVPPGRAWTLGASLFGLALLLLLPVALAYHAAGAPVRHYQFGLFQPALLAAAALTCLTARGLFARASWQRRGALVAVPLVLLVIVVARLAGEAAGGLSYLFRTFAPWQETIGESRSLAAGGLGAGLGEALTQLSGLVVLLPAAWVLLGRRAVRGDPRRGVLLVALVLFTAIGFLQQRFLPHLSLLIGIAAATIATSLVRPRAGRLRAVLAVILILAALLPTLGGWNRTQDPAIALERSRSVLDFLASETPPTSHYDDPRETPEYGVAAEWSYGHFIQYYGRRPAVVDNFGDHAGDPTRVRSFFLETDEKRALALLDSMHARYVLVRDLAASFQGLIPDAEARERFIAWAGLVAPGTGTIQFSPRILETLLYRLAWRNGSGIPGGEGEAVPPLSRLRMVAESEETEQIPGGPTVPYVKLYEVVAGVRLRVAGLRPGEQGVFLAAVSSPRGRVFPYVTELWADSSGVMELVVPYPTVGDEGKSRFAECEIATREGRFAVPPIDERAIREGATVLCGGNGVVPRTGTR